MSTAPPLSKPRLRGVSHQWGFVVSLAAGAALIALAPHGRATVAAAIYAGAVSALLGTLAIPFLAGFAWGGTLRAGLEALLWAGFVRVFLVHHVTWSINSICHFFGARRFDTSDFSTNVFWLALPSLGEAWHHNHHAFPR